MRLLANEPAVPSAAVAALRDRAPHAAELSSLASQLALQGVNVAPQTSTASAAAWKKWLVAGSGVSAVLVGLAVLRAPERAGTLGSAPGRHPAASADQAERPPAQPGVSPHSEQGSPSQAARPAATVAIGLAEPSVAPASDVAPALVGSAASSATLGTGATSRDDQPADKTAASRHSASSPPLKPETKNDAPRLSGSATAPSEIELLRDARLALRQAPARALAVAEEHAHLYPHGKLTQERELIAISALVALGRRTAALSRVAAFERAFPASPYRKQIGDLLR